MVRIVFLRALYHLSDEDCEHLALNRISFQRFCRVDGLLNIPGVRAQWKLKQRPIEGGLGVQAIFDTVSLLPQHGNIPVCRRTGDVQRSANGVGEVSLRDIKNTKVLKNVL
jgi:IS5 family transposase